MAKFISYRADLGQRRAVKYVNLAFVQEAQFVEASGEEPAVLSMTLTDGTVQTVRGPDAEAGIKLIDAHRETA